MNFKFLENKKIYTGKVFDIEVDKIEYDSGNKATREVVIHNGGSVIVAVTNSNKLILISQFRYPFKKHLLELPAGKLELDEDPMLCAQRELKEETGYSSDELKKLGEIYTSPGFCSEILHIFLATNLIPGKHKREEGEEGMKIFESTLEEIEMKISDGQILDSKTICGIHFYKRFINQ